MIENTDPNWFISWIYGKTYSAGPGLCVLDTNKLFNFLLLYMKDPFDGLQNVLGETLYDPGPGPLLLWVVLISLNLN